MTLQAINPIQYTDSIKCSLVHLSLQVIILWLLSSFSYTSFYVFVGLYVKVMSPRPWLYISSHFPMFVLPMSSSSSFGNFRTWACLYHTYPFNLYLQAQLINDHFVFIYWMVAKFPHRFYKDLSLANINCSSKVKL